MVKIPNPFYYPLAILLGGISLVLGVRLLELPSAFVLPSAVMITTATATGLKSREPDPEKIAKQRLEQELNQIKSLAQNLANKAELLRQEVSDILARGEFQLEFLVEVQSFCDRYVLFPKKIDQLSQKISGREALLSAYELEEQLLEVKKKISNSSGIAKQHLEQLAAGLEKNILLAKKGQDTRQVQILSLHTLIQDAAGTLQELQNKLRISNLERGGTLEELQALGHQLNQYQDNVDILIDSDQ